MSETCVAWARVGAETGIERICPELFFVMSYGGLGQVSDWMEVFVARFYRTALRPAPLRWSIAASRVGLLSCEAACLGGRRWPSTGWVLARRYWRAAYQYLEIRAVWNRR